VQGVVGDVQRELNAVFNLDRRLGGESPDGDTEPVQISVDSDDEDEKRSDEADEADDARKTAPERPARPPSSAPVQRRFKFRPRNCRA